MKQQTRTEKTKELVEATLIMGARRGSDKFMSHDEAKKKIEPHIQELTKRFENISDEYDSYDGGYHLSDYQ